MQKFIININATRHKVILKLKISKYSLKTSQFPKTALILNKYLPTIFRNKCFNNANIPFVQEVLNTEISHLFEHVLLENMCLIKIKYVDSVAYDGRTFWDIDQNNGEYRIEIQCHLYDWPIFIKALSKSIQLMDLIMEGDIAATLPIKRSTKINTLDHLDRSLNYLHESARLADPQL